MNFSSIASPIDLLSYLKSLDLLKNSPSWWWPNALSFEVLLGAILTQNTKWSNVETSLSNLKNEGILNAHNDKSLSNFANVSSIYSLIIPSGFANQKSARIITLCQNILESFGDFASFQDNVSKQWLLSQKGLGHESSDAILNYACGREVFVVDKYTYKLFCSIGIEIQDYEELQSYIVNNLNDNLKDIYNMYEDSISLAQIYARMHGKIVEFSKQKTLR